MTRGPIFDQGYAWVALLGSTGLNIIVSMGFTGMGILYIAFIDYFNIKKSQVAWIGLCDAIVYPISGEYIILLIIKHSSHVNVYKSKLTDNSVGTWLLRL